MTEELLYEIDEGLQNKTVYIYGVNEFSKIILFLLINKSIYVKAFISDENIGLKFFNKPVISFSQINTDEDYVILLNDEKINCDENLNYIKHFLKFKNSKSIKYVSIYGMGMVGCQLMRFLKWQGIVISHIFDSNKAGQIIDGKTILNHEEIKTLQDDEIIIVCGKYYEEISQCIDKINKNIIKYFVTAESDIIRNINNIDIIDGICANSSAVFKWCTYLNDVKCLLYGENKELVYRYSDILNFLDFDVDVCAAGEKTECIEEVLYQSKVFIVLTDDYVNDSLKQTLYELGLAEALDYTHINYVDRELKLSRRQILDINLGYGYRMNYKYPGFDVYGDDAKFVKRIVTLGGSTTDGQYSVMKSWPKQLYDKYGKPNNYCIINGGCVGYDSSQELIKLMRDVVNLKPNILIVYNGYNDAFYGAERTNQFENKYIDKIFDAGNKNITDWKMGWQNFVRYDVWKGVPDRRDLYTIWIQNLCMMELYCRMNNIRFYAFLQPMLMSKNNIEISDKNRILMSKVVYSERQLSAMCKFREYGKLCSNQYPWFTDLSSALDGKDGYLDMCHLNEYGNEIIADCVWNVICKDLLKNI